MRKAIGSESPEIILVKSDKQNICFNMDLLNAEVEAMKAASIYDPAKVRVLAVAATDTEEDTASAQWVMNDMAAHSDNLKVVILLGKRAKDMVLPDTPGVMSSAGKFFDRDIGFGMTKFLVNYSTWMVTKKDINLYDKYRQIFNKVSMIGHEQSFPCKALDLEGFKSYVKRLKKYLKEGKLPYLIYDIETSNPYDSKKPVYHIMGGKEFITGFSLADPVEQVGYYVSIKHPGINAKFGDDFAKKQEKEVKKLLIELLKTMPLVCHNAKFDLSWSSKYLDIPFDQLNLYGDTMIMAYLIIGRDAGIKFSLKELVSFYFDINRWDEDIDEEIKAHRLVKDRRLINVKLETLEQYGAMDSIATLRLLEKFQGDITEYGMEEIYQILLEAVIAFADMELHGTCVNVPLLNWLNDYYTQYEDNVNGKMNEHPMAIAYKEEKELTELKVGTKNMTEFVWGYGRNQLMLPEYLPKDRWGNKIDKNYTSPKGGPSLAQAVKIWMFKNKPTDSIGFFGQMMCLSQELKSMKTKYLKPIQTWITDAGRFHPDYNIIGTTTGRLSSYFHTLPSFGDIKTLFNSDWASEGGLIMAPDYSQLEVRVIAAMSKDEDLKRSYIEGRDIHKFVASKIYGVGYDDVNKIQRSHGKNVVFGIIYGESHVTLAQKLNVSNDDALELHNLLFKNFPGLNRWIEGTKEMLMTKGYSMSAFNRRRYMKNAMLEPTEENDRLIQEALRGGVNSPIQSTASDLNLTTLLAIRKKLIEKKMKSFILGTVHDSIELDVHPSEILDVFDLIKSEGQTRLEGLDWANGVPFRVDVEMGTSWGFALDSELEEQGDGWKILEMSGRKMNFDTFSEAMKKNKYHDFEVMHYEEIEWSDKDEDPNRLFKGALKKGDKVSAKVKISKKPNIDQLLEVQKKLEQK